MGNRKHLSFVRHCIVVKSNTILVASRENYRAKQITVPTVDNLHVNLPITLNNWSSKESMMFPAMLNTC